MSAYDDAVAYLDAEVHPRCDYDIYSDMRDIVDDMQAENAKLRELAKAAWGCVNRHVSCDECRMVCCGCTLQSAMRELGIEVEDDD